MPQYSFAEAQHCGLNDEIESVIDWAERTYRIDPGRGEEAATYAKCWQNHLKQRRRE